MLVVLRTRVAQGLYMLRGSPLAKECDGGHPSAAVICVGETEVLSRGSTCNFLRLSLCALSLPFLTLV